MLNQVKLPQTKADYYPMKGGLDLVTPPIEVDPGTCFDAQNYEPAAVGGYRRINGYERSDGRTSPTSAAYWVISITLTGAIANGVTVTGATSGATGRALGLYASNATLVLGRVTGTFVSGEALQVTGVTQATSTSAAIQGGAQMPSDDADYRLLAANDRRADIGVVTGSGDIRGGFVFNDVCYAFRDNAGGTAGDLYKQTAGGWSKVTFGREIQFSARTGTVTITIAAPGVVTWTAHGLANGQGVQLSTTGALPTGLVAGTTYYLVSAGANTFQLAATVGGAAITTTGTQSGTHTALLVTGSGFTNGATVTGATSGATAVIVRTLLRTGTWTTSPVGTLVFATVTGTFTNGEALQTGGLGQVQATTADTAIARATGGHVEAVLANFSGSTATKYVYGCDGVNPAFEFDGTNYIPIRTGMTADTPLHIAFHKTHLFLSFLGSLQYSGVNAPYSWTVLTGAAEIGMGEDITGMYTQAGSSAGASLAVFTTGKTSILYGSGSSDFNLVPSVYDLGYQPYTLQPAGNNMYGLTPRGIQALQTTLGYGDFNYSATSFVVQPLLDTKAGMACASVTLKAKNQYRIYFTDGTALVIGLTGPQSSASLYGIPTRDNISGIMPLSYGLAVKCIWNATLSNGTEVTYFGSTNGYVYQDNVGTSFDGGVIEAWIRPSFNNMKSPRVRKQYRRAVFEVKCDGYSLVNVSYDLGYATPNVNPAAIQIDQSIMGGGGYWDQFTWDQFTWDSPVVANADMSIDGTETNIGFLFYSKRAQDDAHTVSGVSLLYTPRRLVRSGT